MRALVAITIVVALTASVGATPSAEQLYEEGQQAFNKGDYATAVARWQESYESSKLPLLMLNIAQAYRLRGDCLNALLAYRKYLTLLDIAVDADPTPEQRSIAVGSITELEPKCGQRHVDQDGASRIDADPGRTKRLVGIASAGTGFVLLATGFYFGHKTSSLGDEVTSKCSLGCDWGVYSHKDAEGRSAARTQWVFHGLGVAAIATGGILYWLGRQQRHTSSIAVTPHHDGAAITWSRSW